MQRNGGQDEEEEDDGPMMQHNQDMEPSGFEGRGGALVEDAKKMMRDEDDDGPAGGQAENAGPKIKMNKIGRRAGKAKVGAGKDGAKGTGGIDMDYKPTKAQGAFTEQDIEFMKKAI